MIINKAKTPQKIEAVEGTNVKTRKQLQEEKEERKAKGEEDIEETSRKDVRWNAAFETCQVIKKVW